jgi:hypothetical protein
MLCAAELRAHPTENSTSTSVEIIAIPNYAPNAAHKHENHSANSTHLHFSLSLNAKNDRNVWISNQLTWKSEPLRNRG